jgi:hypothetical protein
MDLTDATVRTHCEAAALETLETMFFEIPEEPPVMGRPMAGAVWVEAPFHGSLEGSICVVSLKSQFADLAEAFLGWETSRPPAKDRAVLIACEFANMLAGSFVSRYRPRARLTIEQPAAVAPEAVMGPDWLTIPLAGGALWIRLRFEER